MANPHKGEVDITLNDKLYTLAFDWNAIARAQDEVGDEALQQIFTFNIKTLAQLVAIGLAKHHSAEATTEFVMAASPPVNEMRQALDKAMALAYFGKDGLPVEDEVKPDGDNAEDEGETKKK